MCGRFVEINHAKQQINAFSGNLFIPLTNRHNLWIIIICKKCSVKSDHRNILRHPQTRRNKSPAGISGQWETISGRAKPSL